MSLEKYTDKELQAELEKRNLVKHEDDHHLCVGLIDQDGAESLILANTPKLFASTIRSLQLRARFNAHRRPVIFSVKIPLSLFGEIDSQLKAGKYEEASEAIRSLPNFRPIGF
jgi:hypothetical protein